jgi:hypothetical protein
MKVCLLLRQQHAFQEPTCNPLNPTLHTVSSQMKQNRTSSCTSTKLSTRYCTLPYSVTEFYSFQEKSHFLANMAASLVTFFSCFLHGLLVIITALTYFLLLLILFVPLRSGPPPTSNSDSVGRAAWVMHYRISFCRWRCSGAIFYDVTNGKFWPPQSFTWCATQSSRQTPVALNPTKKCPTAGACRQASCNNSESLFWVTTSPACDFTHFSTAWS